MSPTIKFALFVFISSQAIYAADIASWICRESASTRSGNILLVCGVGEAPDEHNAKIAALRNAAEEFKEICSQSADCRDRQYRVEPKRTDCEKTKDGYKCYRAFLYEITRKVSTQAFLKYQQQLLDEEISLTQEKLDSLRQIKEKERTLASLKQQVESGTIQESATVPEQPHQRHWAGILAVGGSTFPVGVGSTPVVMELGGTLGYLFSSALGLDFTGFLSVSTKKKLGYRFGTALIVFPFSGWFIGPELGINQVSYDQAAAFDRINQVSIRQAFFGGTLGYRYLTNSIGYEVRLGICKYQDVEYLSGKPGALLTVGISWSR